MRLFSPKGAPRLGPGFSECHLKSRLMESPKVLLENEKKIAYPLPGVPPNADCPGVSATHPLSGGWAYGLRFENV